MVLILLGLFTGKNLYQDWISIFYSVSQKLELKIGTTFVAQDLSELDLLLQLQELGERYYFTELYKQDLAVLYSKSM
jgi:hypothetical protein